jgi:hypothetical protein
MSGNGNSRVTSRSPIGSQLNGESLVEAEEEVRDPFPEDCLPGALQNMAEEVSEVFRVPISLSSVCALGVCSAALGSGIGVRNSQGKLASPNLYILVSVMSGTGKSDVLREFRVPIDEMEDALIKDHNKKSARLETELRCLEIDIKELEKKCKKGAAPDLKEEMGSLLLKKKELSDLASFSPRLLLDDTTSERAAALLQASGEQLALISPDAGDVAQNLLGKYRKGNNTDEYLYLKAFSREHAKVHRIGRPAICLKEPCMSIMLFFQPDILQLLFSNERLRRGGFLARCLIADTQAKAQMIDGVVRPIREDIKANYHALITKLLRCYRLSPKCREINATAEANEVFRAHWNKLVPSINGKLKDISPMVARWTELAWRIALVLHAASFRETAVSEPLGKETAMISTKLMRWFAGEQIRSLRSVRGESEQKEVEHIREVICRFGTFGTEMTARDLQRRHHIDVSRVLDLATRYPEALTASEGVKSPAGGRPSVVISIPQRGQRR